MEILKAGIVGCGKVSHLHAKALQSVKNAKLAAVQSRSINKADSFGSQYQVNGYDDVEKMIRQEGLDLVIICTPHPFHYSPTEMAADLGAHVLVEKPIASTLEDTDKMIEACKKAKVKLGVISQRRFYEPVKRVKQAIDGGKIGMPVLGTVNMLGWRDEAYYQSDAWRGTWEMEGGGVLVNQAPHQLDILQWFMGPVDELFGYWANLNHPYIEVEDTALALLKFRNGGLGNIIVSNSQKPGIYGKVHVHGNNGASVGVQTDGGAMFIAGMSNIQEPPVNDVWSIPGEETELTRWKEKDSKFFSSIDPTTYYHQLQIEDFTDAILNDKKPLVTGEEGRVTVEIFSAIYRSQRDGKPVKFPVQPENSQDMDGRIK
ncbi:MAG: Gfo/Idh/MocA family protein [Candidatus Cyclobacteriaceae bacterium M3_2C_046]